MHTLRGLVVQRRLPRAVCAGDLLVVHVAIVNTRRRMGGWILAVEDTVRRLGNGRGGHAATARSSRPSVLFPYVPARQTVSGDYRGRLAAARPLPTGSDAGLDAVSLRAVPLFVHLRHVGHADGACRGWAGSRRAGGRCGTSRSPAASAASTGRASTAISTACGPGSAATAAAGSIGGRTARTGEVMVRQFEQPHSRDAAIVLDLWQPAAARTLPTWTISSWP